MPRTQRILVSVALALAVAGVLVIVSESSEARQRSDFTIDFSAGLLIRESHPSSPYDQAMLGATMRQVAPAGNIDPRLPFSLPWAAALPFAALSLLPFDIAFRIWQLVSAAALIAAIVALQRAAPLGPRAPAFAVLGLLAAVPTWAALTEGQVTPFLALGGALVVLSLRQNGPVIAAVAGLLLAIKPQYLPAYLVVLFAARRWRSLLAALAGATLLLLSPLAAGGIDGVRSMLHNALGANQVVPVRLTEAWIGSLSAVIPADLVTAVSLGLYVVAMLALVLVAWRRPAPGLWFAVLAGSLVLLASPPALPHHQLLLLVPGWLSFALAREGVLSSPLIGLLLADLALVVDQRGLGLAVAPIVMTGVLVYYGWEFTLRAAQPRRPQAARVA